MSNLNLDDPEFQEKVPQKVFFDLGRGYSMGLIHVLLEFVLPGWLQRVIFFISMLAATISRLLASPRIAAEVAILSYGIWQLSSHQPPSFSVLIQMDLAGQLVNYAIIFSQETVADKISFWLGVFLLNTSSILTLLILYVYHISVATGLVLTLLPWLIALVSTFAKPLVAMLTKIPRKMRLPLGWLLKQFYFATAFLFYRMRPLIYRLLERLEKDSLLLDNSRLAQKPRYVYSPIRNPRLFRVLVVERRRLFQQPKCRLETVSLDVPSGHIACSYVWGNSERTKRISIGSHHLQITDSAYRVIRQEQSLLSERRLWLDAICINQEDLEEKVAQIRHMPTIFGRALWVDAFLEFGYADADLWTLLSDLLQKASLQKVFDIKDLDLIVEDDLKLHWDRLADLLTSPWFNRVWALQEAVLAGDLYLNFGMVRIPWPYFPKMLEAIATFTISGTLSYTQSIRNDKHVGSIQDSAERLALARDSKIFGSSNSLYELLSIFHRLQATDPRDKVYGLLSLASSPTSISFPIDYGISETTLLMRTMRWIIREDGPYCLLSCGMGQNPQIAESQLSLPTWVTDWRVPRQGITRHDVPSWHAATEHSFSTGDKTHDPYSMDLRFLVTIQTALDQVGATVLVIPADEFLTVQETDQIDFYRHKWLTQAQEVVLDLQNNPDNIYGDLNSIKQGFYRSLLFDMRDSDDETSLHWDNSNFKSDYEHLERCLNVGGDFTESTLARFRRRTSEWWKQIHGIDADDETDYTSIMTEAILRGRFDGRNEKTAFPLAPDQIEEINRLNKILMRLKFAVGRRIGVTRNGRIGSFPRDALPGDEICLISGAPAPFVVRKRHTGSTDDSKNRSIVGWCYLDGGMDGSLATGPWEQCHLV